jgi:ABC-type antimicrobial peptide transport system permease subunit
VTAIYVPLRQAPATGGLSAAVRILGDPTAVTAAVRRAVASVDPMLAVHRVRTMDDAIVESTFRLKFLATLLGISRTIAVLLSFVGIYSMMAYAVSQRLHEFSVRMACGATTGDVVYLTLKQAGLLTAVGLLIGFLIAFALGGWVSSALFGVVSLDRITVAAVSVTLAVVSFAAAYMPARRAWGGVNPSAILRA